jgi:hypothetical protein
MIYSNIYSNHLLPGKLARKIRKFAVQFGTSRCEGKSITSKSQGQNQPIGELLSPGTCYVKEVYTLDAIYNVFVIR